MRFLGATPSNVADVVPKSYVDGYFAKEFDVRMFGAVCDNATDDGPAVRAAVAAASASGGGTVKITGKCFINSTVAGAGSTQVGVSLPSNVALVGMGRENSWLRRGYNGVLVDHSGSATGFANHVNISSLRDITLHGSGTTTGALLRAYYADNLFVHNTRFIQAQGVGIDAVELWDSYFVSCTWENLLGNDGASPCIRLRNSVAASGFGFSADNCNMVWFANCRWEAFTDGGLWVERGHVSNTSNPYGIFLTHAKFESHTVGGGTAPKGRFVYFDDATMLCGIDKADFFVGAFVGGNTTPVDALVCNAVASVTLTNIRFITSEAAGTMNTGINVFCATGPIEISNIEQRGSNAPVGPLIFFAGGAATAWRLGNVKNQVGTRFGGAIPPSDDRVLTRRSNPQLWTDLVGTNGGNIAPYAFTAVSSGTSSATLSPANNHPGVVRMTSSATANSGGRIVTDVGHLLLAPGDYFECVFNIVTLTNLTMRIGFIDSTTSADVVDGAYLEVLSTGVASFKTANNSARTTNGTTATLSTATWYRVEIDVNASNDARCRVYNSDTGAVVLAEVTNTTNIPGATNRASGAGIIATNSGTTATALVDVDWLAYERRVLNPISR